MAMAQIFVSHSSKDKELVDLLARAFAATAVKGVFEEFEAIRKGPPNAQRIAQDVRESNAVFVVLGRNVETLKHTRDWVGWESGVSAAVALQTNKDVWVIESIADAASLSVVIPHLRHYVCLDPANRWWQGYLTQIISSYDNSHVLPAISAGAATGAAIGEGVGALWGAGIGLVLAALAAPNRPTGMPTKCCQCASLYNVHLATPSMRCPVCNARLVFAARNFSL
jgi:DNA-directed RNA polymerase subunit RPC12/RpoP